MHLYEYDDLVVMEESEALDAVLADIRHHPITADGTGLFTAMRHIDLLCHLTARMAANVEYRHASSNRDLPPTDSLAGAAGHLGQAVAHYTQCLGPLATLAQTSGHGTLRHHLDALGHHSQLRIHLNETHQALTRARTSLTAPPPAPAPPTASRAAPPAPAPARPTHRRP